MFRKLATELLSQQSSYSINNAVGYQYLGGWKLQQNAEIAEILYRSNYAAYFKFIFLYIFFLNNFNWVERKEDI
jgi:hypothetical protein